MAGRTVSHPYLPPEDVSEARVRIVAARTLAGHVVAGDGEPAELAAQVVVLLDQAGTLLETRRAHLRVVA